MLMLEQFVITAVTMCLWIIIFNGQSNKHPYIFSIVYFQMNSYFLLSGINKHEQSLKTQWLFRL